MFRIALKQTMWLELHRRELKEELKLKLFSFVSTWKSSFMFGNFLSNQNFSIVIETLQRLFHSLILSGRRRDVTACRAICFCNLSITKTLNLFSNSKEWFEPTFDHKGKIAQKLNNFLWFLWRHSNFLGLSGIWDWGMGRCFLLQYVWSMTRFYL